MVFRFSAVIRRSSVIVLMSKCRIADIVSESIRRWFRLFSNRLCYVLATMVAHRQREIDQSIDIPNIDAISSAVRWPEFNGFQWSLLFALRFCSATRIPIVPRPQNPKGKSWANRRANGAAGSNSVTWPANRLTFSIKKSNTLVHGAVLSWKLARIFITERRRHRFNRMC